MKKEKSCGSVVYDIIDGELYFLLLKHNSGHYSFAKGHVEDGELEEETAIREVKEETGIDVKVDTSFRYVISYSPKENVIKDVVFFLGNPLSKEITVQYSEVEEVSWYKEDEALDIITYDEDRSVLRDAIYDIKNKLGNNFLE